MFSIQWGTSIINFIKVKTKEYSFHWMSITHKDVNKIVLLGQYFAQVIKVVCAEQWMKMKKMKISDVVIHLWTMNFIRDQTKC